MGNIMRLVFVCVACSIAGTGHAQRVENFLDSIDLNDYSLAFNYYRSQSPFDGVDPFHVIYPVTSSFDHAIKSDSSYFYRDGNIGLRLVSEKGWSLGVIGNLQTLSRSPDDSEALAGTIRRSWTVQSGLTVGKRLGPWSFDVFTSWDILGEHNGNETALKVARLFEYKDWQVVPQLEAIYLSGDLVDHYFGVTPIESSAERPVYTPGSARSYAASIDVAYRISPRWYVTAFAKVESLADEIRDSPLVDKSSVWSAGFGVAYDSAAFVNIDEAGGAQDTFFDATLGAYYINADSSVSVLTPQGPALNLEETQRLDDTALAWPLEIGWQTGRFHRLDLRYFELNRSSGITAGFPIEIGGVVFPTGEQIRTNFRTRIARLAYSFAFFRDEQKELTVLGGISSTNLDFEVRGETETIRAKTNSLLPVIGATGRANFSDRFSLEARLEIFALDVDGRSGDLIDLVLSGTYEFNPRMYAGLGYQLYRQDISTQDETFFGEYRINYHGPLVFCRLRF